MARLFNAYVIVDWSAASKPTTGADSIWVGVLKRDVRFRMAFESHNPPTRAEAETLIAGILDDRAKRSERALIGFDFNLGFPRGLAAGLKLPAETPPWLAVWNQIDRMVKDKADNTNNRFGVGSEINRRLTGGPFPFWGVPPKDALTTLQPKKQRAHGPGDMPEFRHAELAAKGDEPGLEALLPGLGRRAGDPRHPDGAAPEAGARRGDEGLAVRDRLEGADRGRTWPASTWWRPKSTRRCSRARRCRAR